jgi:AcrR family transcriptional regulator
MARRGARTAADPSGHAGGVSVPTRERILDVALDLFIRRGYAETSLREIAAELGFSKAALYYHFESKQDILMALHMRVHGFTDDILPVLEADADPGEVWARLVDVLIGLALRHRALIQLHVRNQEAMAELHRDPAMAKHGPVITEMQDQLMGLLTDPAVPARARIRRFASLGAIFAVLFGASDLEDLPDVELEAALREVARDLLTDGPQANRSAGAPGDGTRAG